MIVMKFGGTSVQDSAAVNRLVEIVRKKIHLHPVVVVSALSKVTDTLQKIANQSYTGDLNGALALTETLQERHILMASQLLSENQPYLEHTLSEIKEYFVKLREIAGVVNILEELSNKSMAKILSFGELLSSYIIYRTLNNAGVKCDIADARCFIITDDEFLKGEPDYNAIRELAPIALNLAFEQSDVVITQGFISGTKNGLNTILGRGGSDYTAALIGMAMNADEIEIWTDVDGVHTTDPRRVENTRSITTMSFSEAAELSFFGAKVLHPATIQPAIEKNIPVRVLNSTEPHKSGTLILKDEEVQSCGVRAISFKEDIVVINIFSMKMLNTFGFLTKLFEVFGKYGVSVDLISTSEVSVSLTVDTDLNLDRVTKEISRFAKVTVNYNKSQVSVVGKNLKETKGLAKRIFGAICEHNITMISQGASDINVSFVVNKEDLDSVITALHKEFFE
ncbi:MAG: lysine-sensitive aspartokinase 3 [Bacteroidetes bacterium HGW-Bacteroidetes-8]|jgi:aspartate kinase|nr:MAG: lysine-sensitive aspartokinase 3 [Bacteroidetes bacterium HGW-Bacteroidetes-8]